ncbi:MAG: hypothetical protein ACYCW6_05375 [Candidatus Xenobia bacterium]
MQTLGLLAVVVVLGALAAVAGRVSLRRAPGHGRILLAAACGALGGGAIGLLLGTVGGNFLGMTPGSAVNVAFFCTGLGFLGLVLGALGGVLWGQRARP